MLQEYVQRLAEIVTMAENEHFAHRASPADEQGCETCKRIRELRLAEAASAEESMDMRA